jgi:N-acetylglutamate synthase-like GNAT family acetyltransferase
VAIREARQDDAPGVAALLGELGYPSSADQAARRIERIAVDPSTWVIVAEVESELAGFGALHVQSLVERTTSRAARSRGSSSRSVSAAAGSASC